MGSSGDMLAFPRNQPADLPASRQQEKPGLAVRDVKYARTEVAKMLVECLMNGTYRHGGHQGVRLVCLLSSHEIISKLLGKTQGSHIFYSSDIMQITVTVFPPTVSLVPVRIQHARNPVLNSNVSPRR